LVPALPTAPTSAIEWQQGFANSHLGWHNMTDFDEIIALIRRTISWLLGQRNLQPADIVILTPGQREGWLVATALEAAGLAVNHILSDNEGKIGRKSRRFHKRTFSPLDKRLKVSTIHSFKGWELPTALVITPPDEKFWEEQSPYLFYVAMTRAQQNLIVFNRFPAYDTYGTTWNERYHDPTAPQPQLPSR